MEVNQPQPLCRESDTKRFYKQVEVVESGCHEWTGRINSSGYGIIYFNKKQQDAHRDEILKKRHTQLLIKKN